jgi:hypothetical protein
MKRKTFVVTVALAIFLCLAGAWWYESSLSKTYTYPISVERQTYTVTVETNWDVPPKVSLSQTSLKYLSVDFIGSQRESVFFKITFPNNLLSGNITLIWKYYLQNPDRYTVTDDGIHTIVQMKFNHTAVDEHFEVRGTKAAW